MDAVGSGFTVTCLDVDAVQPFASVTVTENDVDEVGFTLMLEVVAPVFHENDTPPLAVSVALAPLHIATVTGEITAVGNGLTVTSLDAVAEQPVPLVTVTE